MTHVRFTLDAYPKDVGSIDKAKLRGAARARRSEDPLLRRMLVTHIHCGEPMQFVNVSADQTPLTEGSVERDDSGLGTYRCACGFSFDDCS